MTSGSVTSTKLTKAGSDRVEMTAIPPGGQVETASILCLHKTNPIHELNRYEASKRSMTGAMGDDGNTPSSCRG